MAYNEVNVGNKVKVVTAKGNAFINGGKIPDGPMDFIPQGEGGKFIVNGQFYGLSLHEDSPILVNPDYEPPS